eukprot:TRINITY_DN27688_c0_g1_i1.p1 TRINITY_DN27688_c0_g1~~TRINITY_DN27688_c0_g1_i1.p1  ORF type:complete len:146 (+),score=21.30 TRINITY_DN27688_c0_g1_i1:33-470(+)
MSICLVVLLGLALAVVGDFSVTANVRNEFMDPLLLQASSITQGSWVTNPSKNVAVGTTYVPLFQATGTSGISGSLTYGIASNPKVAVVFNFIDITGNQTNTAKVGPSPWIGGVGPATGTPDNLQIFFWTHEMCYDQDCKKSASIF